MLDDGYSLGALEPGQELNPSYISYLLSLWNCCAVYILEWHNEEEAEGGGDLGSGIIARIPVEGGWPIADYGRYLITSAGEHYGLYTTGKLIKSIQEIFKVLKQRGVSEAGILGSKIAKKVAWLASLEANIKLVNVHPDSSYFETLRNVSSIEESIKHLVKEPKLVV